MDFFWRYIQFLCQKSQKRWMVIFLNARGKSCLLARIVLVKIVRDLAENRNELGLLVEREVGVNIPVDLNADKPRYESKCTRWITHDE